MVPAGGRPPGTDSPLACASPAGTAAPRAGQVDARARPTILPPLGRRVVMMSNWRCACCARAASPPPPVGFGTGDGDEPSRTDSAPFERECLAGASRQATHNAGLARATRRRRLVRTPPWRASPALRCAGARRSHLPHPSIRRRPMAPRLSDRGGVGAISRSASTAPPDNTPPERHAAAPASCPGASVARRRQIRSGTERCFRGRRRSTRPIRHHRSVLEHRPASLVAGFQPATQVGVGGISGQVSRRYAASSPPGSLSAAARAVLAHPQQRLKQPLPSGMPYGTARRKSPFQLVAFRLRRSRAHR
jgi:hypothetical protein